jgi:hypothetical protein
VVSPTGSSLPVNATVSSSTSDASSSLLAFWVRQGNDRWPISKPTVLVVLFAGLFLLVSIMAFGFYILKIQRFVSPGFPLIKL